MEAYRNRSCTPAPTAAADTPSRGWFRSQSSLVIRCPHSWDSRVPARLHQHRRPSRRSTRLRCRFTCAPARRQGGKAASRQARAPPDAGQSDRHGIALGEASDRGYNSLLPEVLARVTSRAVEGPRGPDVLHRVRVRRDWLTVGEVVELELPRNLACAGCGGGGCDTCGRSGAITLRKRSEPAEVVEITLPARRSDELPESHGLTLRIPEQGGLPEA